jgi:hypothetical protein
MSRKIDAAGNGALSISFVTRSRWKSHSRRRRSRTATQRELPGEIGTQREQADVNATSLIVCPKRVPVSGCAQKGRKVPPVWSSCAMSRAWVVVLCHRHDATILGCQTAATSTSLAALCP